MKEEIIKLRKEGYSYSEIQKILGCSKSTISYHCKNIEISKDSIKFSEKNISENLINEVLLLRAEKLSYSKIRKKLNIDLSDVEVICKTFYKQDFKSIKEENLEIDTQIKNLYEEKLSKKEIATRLNVSEYLVKKVLPFTERKTKNLNDRKKDVVQNVISWRRRTKEKLILYKGGECVKCGYKKCIEALEFHHEDPKEKDFTISGKSWSLEKLKKEVDKCILVCSNCHKEIHYELKKKMEI